MLTTALIKELISVLFDVEKCNFRELGKSLWCPKGSLKSPAA